MDYRVLIGFISEWLGAVSVSWLLSLSPRLKKPLIGFKFARRDGFVALSLYALVLLFAFIFYSFNPPIFSNPLRMAPAPVNDLGQALLLAVITTAAFGAALIVRKQPIRAMGWNQAVFMPALQMGFAMGILTIFLHNRVMDVLGGLTPERINLLLLALGVALAEETVFRGYIQQRLGWWLGAWQGLVLTALAFTLWHAPALLGLPFETMLILLGLTFVEALVLGWIMKKTGHVVAPAVYRTMSIWMAFFV